MFAVILIFTSHVLFVAFLVLLLGGVMYQIAKRFGSRDDNRLPRSAMKKESPVYLRMMTEEDSSE